MDLVQRGSWWALAVSPFLTVLHCPGSRMGFVQHVSLVLCGVKARQNGFKPTWILYCTKGLTWIGSVRVIGVVCYLSQTCFAMGLLQSRWDYQASLPKHRRVLEPSPGSGWCRLATGHRWAALASSSLLPCSPFFPSLPLSCTLLPLSLLRHAAPVPAPKIPGDASNPAICHLQGLTDIFNQKVIGSLL